MDARQKLFWEMMAQQKCGALPRHPLCPYCHDDVTELGDYGQFHCPACDGVWSPDEEPYTVQIKDGEWF